MLSMALNIIQEFRQSPANVQLDIKLHELPAGSMPTVFPNVSTTGRVLEDKKSVYVLIRVWDAGVSNEWRLVPNDQGWLVRCTVLLTSSLNVNIKARG